MRKWHVILRGFLVLAACWSIPARATEGDVFAKGTKYKAATYDASNPLTGKNHPSYYGHNYKKPVDINIGSGDDDEDRLLYAPEDGIVTRTHNNTDCWGYAVEWSNQFGTEKIFMAHLNEITKEGNVGEEIKVYGGEVIGRLGGTGGPKCQFDPHLHIESSTGWLKLSGEEIRPPINPPGNGALYTSSGPIKKFFYVWEPARRFSNEEDYGIGWWPSDVPCLEAKEWTTDKKSILNTDNSICREAFNILAERSWYWDGTSDFWDKVFFEDFDPQCKAN